ncbi:MAG: metallophosphoesterase [Mariniphaga sp.]|nr:metallophosphoesterase [Mariniphaga sp.]MDD4226243.1 metallophosphoesterase [Mariniphaga sp.]MDD4425547.1 metallophosphoesterase [Mariniphaga sp.]
MKRKEFLQLTTVFMGGITLNCIGGQKHQLQTVKIGLITDLHYANRITPQGSTRYYRESINKLSECIAVMNEHRVHFFIQLGDFKDQDDPPREEDTLTYLTEIETEFHRFNGPIYHVLGNHDHDSISKQQFLDHISNEGFEKALNFYSFDTHGFHCIVLDANFTSEGTGYNRGNFNWKDTYIPDNQLKWLKSDLHDHRDKPAIIFIHQRLDELDGEKDHFVKNAQAVRSILEESGNVILVLQGHDHRGDLNQINHIVYYTLKAAVEGSGLVNNNYAILEINQELEMRITGFRNTESKNISSENIPDM